MVSIKYNGRWCVDLEILLLGGGFLILRDGEYKYI